MTAPEAESPVEDLAEAEGSPEALVKAAEEEPVAQQPVAE
jgi:hypothetical protein